MDKNLSGIQQALEALIMGKIPDEIGQTSDPDLDLIIDLVNILGRNLSEATGFIRNLSKGNLDVDVPGRRNYLAAPLKELHSQMNNYIWIAQQVKAGKVVDKLDFAGEFGDALNTLVEIALYGNRTDAGACGNPTKAADIRSYQFHQLYLAFNHLGMMVLEVDESDKIIFANKSAIEFFGQSAYFNEQSVKPEVGTFTATVLSLLAQGSNYPQLYEIYDDQTGKWYKITIDRIQLPTRQNVIMYIIEDVSDIKSSVQELTKDATIDYLSSAVNRREGMKALERIVKDTERSVTYCVSFMDMDNLKYINDNFGHVEGDYAIKSMADAFIGSVRNSDTVSRFGGDEFLIVFHNCNLSEAERAISRMHEKITDLNNKGIKPFRMDFSHGVMEITPSMNLNVKDIIMLLDKKMYERKSAKKAGDPSANL